MARIDELRAGLDHTRDRIAQAARAAGRDAREITLVVVTKFFPESDVRLLAELGVTDVGENRHQEAQRKAAACADLGLRWHFIGSLQSNKAAAVAAYADVVSSVDRAKLLPGLSRGLRERHPAATGGLEVLVQVSLDDPDAAHHRGGVPIAGAGELCDLVDDTDGLRLRGVMGVAPLGGDAAAAFRVLGEVAARIRAEHPGADWISAGMSHDLEPAIAAGATHVRIGSAILGNRPEIK